MLWCSVVLWEISDEDGIQKCTVGSPWPSDMSRLNRLSWHETCSAAPVSQAARPSSATKHDQALLAVQSLPKCSRCPKVADRKTPAGSSISLFTVMTKFNQFCAVWNTWPVQMQELVAFVRQCRIACTRTGLSKWRLDYAMMLACSYMSPVNASTRILQAW